jgi:hypothetical protein
MGNSLTFKPFGISYVGMATAVLEQAPAINVNSAKAGQVALKGFFRIAKQWGLKPAEQRVLLGDLPQTTYCRYQKLPEVQLSRDLLERLSYVLGIYKALHILFQDPAHADGWIRRANEAYPFNASSALEYMLQGSLTRLAEVRLYLDTQRG